MKKFIAILLSVLCIFSIFTCSAFAGLEDVLGGILGEDTLLPEEDGIDQALSCGIFYEMETLSFITVTYKPQMTFTFKQPVVAKVTTDTPLSVDYQFVCWKEQETGKYYYPGDEILVTGKVVLIAVWEEKTDNYPQFIRVVINSLEMISHMLNKVLGYYNIYYDYIPVADETAPETTAPATTVAA